jgi:hypothetical protein
MIRVIEGSLSDRVIQYLDDPARTPRTVRETDAALGTLTGNTVWNLAAKGVLKLVGYDTVSRRPHGQYKLVGEVARVTRERTILKPTVRQQAILELVKRWGRTTSGAVALELGLSKSRVRTDMVALRKAEQLEMVCIKTGPLPEWFWQPYGATKSKARRQLVRPIARRTPKVKASPAPRGNPITDFLAQVMK